MVGDVWPPSCDCRSLDQSSVIVVTFLSLTQLDWVLVIAYILQNYYNFFLLFVCFWNETKDRTDL